MNSEGKELQSLLNSSVSLFLTGGAGTGKSFLITEYQKKFSSHECPIVASTGVSAWIIGGRTFHSFFGLGCVDQGEQACYQNAIIHPGVRERVTVCHTLIIDEISMLSGSLFCLAEKIAQKIRKNSKPWGGIRIIAAGDFFQLPPVQKTKTFPRDWSFLSETWKKTNFVCLELKKMKRTKDKRLFHFLSDIRLGKHTQEMKEYFLKKVHPQTEDFVGTHLFPQRAPAEKYNQKKLNELSGKLFSFPTQFSAIDSSLLEGIKKSSLLPDILYLKNNALVMFRKNDPEGRWVNGSLGTVKKIQSDKISLTLLSGKEVILTPEVFDQYNALGKKIGSLSNFPLSLAYATTIHKAQGMTIDRIRLQLKGSWEPGQVYVGLSRVTSGDGISLYQWDPSGFRVDPDVISFYQQLNQDSTS